jgi:hypothetical protein
MSLGPVQDFLPPFSLSDLSPSSPSLFAFDVYEIALKPPRCVAAFRWRIVMLKADQLVHYTSLKG